MARFRETISDYKKSKRASFAVYITLRVLAFICMLSQSLRGEWENAFLCFLALILYTLPIVFRGRFKIELPILLEIIIFFFIFASQILGSIYNFYGNIPHWDTILHTINGFICAGIGFSLVDLLNNNSKKIKLTPLYVSLIAFCFSMTVGVCWEFFEYSLDKFFYADTQNDVIVNMISSDKLSTENSNKTIIKDIDKTIIYDSEGIEIATIKGGYLDIGLNDTMKDLLVNFIGAVVFCSLGYFYIQNRDKYQFAENFIPRKLIDNIH